MHTGSIVTVEYKGELITREIIRVTQYDMHNIYWLEGINDECFSEKDFK